MAGCFSDPRTPSVDGNNDANANNSTSANANNSSCVPDACPADSCGILDDGCGGTLDCGACACDGDVPTEPSCGPCGLGATICDTAAGTCELPGLPDIDTSSCDTEIVFAVPNGGTEPSGDGSKEDPFTTINAALDAAEMGGASLVVVGGTGTTVREVIMREGVSIVAGYDTDFVRDSSRRPQISVGWAEPRYGDLMGVAAVEIEAETHFSGFDVSTDDNPANGDNNYAVYLKDSPGLVIDDITATAGAGGAGVAGQNGQDGADGGDGGNGGNGREYVDYYDNDTAGGVGGSAGLGGGDGSCASPGGAGGQGADFSPTATNGRNGLPGDNSGGSGGTSSNPNGSRGNDAPQPLAEGDPGEGGGGPGTVIDGTWTNMDGFGTEGMAGRDGQGGGGGGGAYHGPADGNGDAESGPGGGGGGGGGCAGEGGQGGSPGGGSFGLFAINSDGVQITNSSFAAGSGGDGGAGGVGGEPGEGGAGGSGSNSIQGIDQFNIYQSFYSGGRGGDGTSGTRGGDGGAGAGGVSYGVYCLDTTLDMSGAELTFEAGEGGRAGGEGALAGEEADVVGCSGTL